MTGQPTLCRASAWSVCRRLGQPAEQSRAGRHAREPCEMEPAVSGSVAASKSTCQIYFWTGKGFFFAGLIVAPGSPVTSIKNRSCDEKGCCHGRDGAQRAGLAQAGPNISHSASADPLSQGRIGLGTCSNVSTFAVINDLGSTDSWAIDDNGTQSGGFGFCTYRLSATPAWHAQDYGWKFTTEVRVVDAPDPSAGQPPIGFDASPFFRFLPGTADYSVFLGSSCLGQEKFASVAFEIFSPDQQPGLAAVPPPITVPLLALGLPGIVARRMHTA